MEEIENNGDDDYKVFGKLLKAAISVSANAGPDSPEAKHADECVRKDYETRFKNDDIVEGLKKAYEVGFKKGFRMAKLEDMPWLSKDEYEKERKECDNKQQQHPLKQLQQQRQQKI
ncbi:MAG: hypothetical protein M3299_06790 [Thermoproteota archaeon]|nr:hypothetical protein [Thermoproteota archaeon]